MLSTYEHALSHISVADTLSPVIILTNIFPQVQQLLAGKGSTPFFGSFCWFVSTPECITPHWIAAVNA